MIWLSVALAADQDVLLLGNSYTRFNDLAEVLDGDLEGAVESWPDTEVVALTQGGQTLAGHLEAAEDPDSAWHEELVTRAGTYEWVVLQDQSQIPGFPKTHASWQASKDAAVALDGLIDAHGAETLLMLTWGRRDGDAQNPDRYPDFPTMQDHLTEGTLAYAAAIDREVTVAPAGLAFAQVHATLPDRFEELYTGDGSHPSETGTELVSYVLLASITGRSPVGLEGDAELQEVARAVVLDDPFGEIPYLWAMDWEEVDPSQPIGGGGVRPQVRVTQATATDVELDDAVLHLEHERFEGRITGEGEVLATRFHVVEHEQVDLEGSFRTTELVVEVDEPGLLLCATELEFGAVQLPTGRELFVDGGCLELVEAGPIADSRDGTLRDGCGCTGSAAALALAPLLLLRRRWS